jgi:hypothetical protein
MRLRRLDGQAAEDYVCDLSTILRAARLNQHYPDPEALAAWLEGLRPSVHRGILPGLEIDLRSGLPARGLWQRLRVEHGLAPASLALLRPREELEARARRYPRGPYQEHLRRQAWYGALVGLPAFPLDERRAMLRRPEPDGRHWIQVLRDGLTSEGMPVRLTLQLRLADGRRRPKAPLGLEQEVAVVSDALWKTVEGLLELDAELAFARLREVPGLVPQEVQRTSLGPVFVQGLKAVGPAAEAGQAFVGTFGHELAGLEGADRDNDPLSPARERPRAEADEAACRRARDEAGLKVFRDRKLVVPAALVSRVEAWCRTRGTRNVTLLAPDRAGP